MAMSKQTRTILMVAGAGAVLYWLYNQSQAAAAQVVTGAPAIAPPQPDSSYYGPYPSSGGQASSGYDMTTGSYVGGQ